MEATIETAVLMKLRRLPPTQQQEVLHFVEFLATKLQTDSQEHVPDLAAAAQALLADYETDAELTAFTALDGQDFHA